jgi:nucleoside-diphosphate-sugar epimerase
VAQIVDALLEAFGHKPGEYPVEFGAGTPGDQFGMQADITRIKAELSWAPKVELDEGIRRMVAWARSLKRGQA